MAPNVSGVGTPGRRTVYSMCGMCAVRCPMEVTVEDGKIVWLQGNHHDKAIGTSFARRVQPDWHLSLTMNVLRHHSSAQARAAEVNGGVHPGMKPSIISPKSCMIL